MAKLYAKRIADGRMTLDDVPERWKAEVEALLPAEYARRILAGKMTIDEVPERWREEVEALLADG